MECICFENNIFDNDDSNFVFSGREHVMIGDTIIVNDSATNFYNYTHKTYNVFTIYQFLCFLDKLYFQMNFFIREKSIA